MMEGPVKGELLDGSQPLDSKTEAIRTAQSVVDDDIYEDAGDLDFALSSHNTYLSRLPIFLWKAWASLKDGEEISLGSMRVESEHGRVQRARLPFSEGAECG